MRCKMFVLIIISLLINKTRALSIPGIEEHENQTSSPLLGSQTKSIGSAIRPKIRKIHDKFNNFDSLTRTEQKQLIDKYKGQIKKLENEHQAEYTTQQLASLGMWQERGSRDDTFLKNNERLKKVLGIIKNYEKENKSKNQTIFSPRLRTGKEKQN